ncbi:MAG: hypothetical protein WBR18_13500 [Anaerolineales bacterium]
MDARELLFVVWSFVVQLLLIVHFALRKWRFDPYIPKVGWLFYLLGLPALAVSIVLASSGLLWSFWVGGILQFVFSIYGFIVEYVRRVQWRSPLLWPVAGPYLTLYLGMIMFYWWPLGLIDRRLWIGYTVLFVTSTILNLTSHTPLSPSSSHPG